MFRKMLSNERGQAVVELALITPILLMLLLGIIEFARLYNSYLTLDHATRAGARIATVGASDIEIENKVHDLTSGLPDSASVEVAVSPEVLNRIPGNDITVEADYSFKFIAPLLGNIFGNPKVLTSTVTMRLE